MEKIPKDMPSITHAIIGGVIGLLLYTYTLNQPKRFKAEHVIAFTLNCFVGPDLPKFFSPFFNSDYWQNVVFVDLNGFVHTYVGWAITAVGLSVIYYYIFRLSKEARQTKKAPISLWHVYLLILAGGFNHFGMDLTDTSVNIFPNIFGLPYSLNLSTLTKTGTTYAVGPLASYLSWFTESDLLLFGLFALVILIWLLKNKSPKQIWLWSAVFFVIIYGLIISIGGNVIHNETDLGMIVYVSLSWLFPLICCFVSMEPNIQIPITDDK